MTDERSLGDAPEPDEDEQKVTASDYAAGVRPGRARVKIRHNLHLYPRLQEIAEQIETAPDDEVDALVDEFDDLRDQMETVFVLERRSAEWLKETAKRHRKAMKLPKGGANDIAKGKVTYDQLIELGLRIVADQTIEPADATWETLRDLYESGAVDAATGRPVHDALSLAVQDLNSGRYEVLTLDFSQRRSTTRGKRRSSTR